jgi:molecular chaperone GrpE (heat shock protein)
MVKKVPPARDARRFSAPSTRTEKGAQKSSSTVSVKSRTSAAKAAVPSPLSPPKGTVAGTSPPIPAPVKVDRPLASVASSPVPPPALARIEEALAGLRRSFEAEEERSRKVLVALEEQEGRRRKAFEAIEARLETLRAPVSETPSPVSVEGGDIDDTAKAFGRAVADIVDRRLEEILSPVAALYQRLQEEARAFAGSAPPTGDELKGVIEESVADLRKILKALGGDFIVPQAGEPYDPLIHLAVGETSVPGAEEGMIAGVVRPGYRSGRGRVVLPARVLVARR